MKREIKFRSAHYTIRENTFSHFSYWGKVDHKGNYSEDCFSSPSSASSCYREAEEQFTGLKDKNGVDIYEGDVLKGYKILFKVEYNTQNSSFCINPISDDILDVMAYQKLGDGYYSRKDLKVVGNIHENKDLMQ